MAKGYAEGPAAEEAERRREELERGVDEPRREQRLAVYGSTPDRPERHFIQTSSLPRARHGGSPWSALRCSR